MSNGAWRNDLATPSGELRQFLTVCRGTDRGEMTERNSSVRLQTNERRCYDIDRGGGGGGEAGGGEGDSGDGGGGLAYYWGIIVGK